MMWSRRTRVTTPLVSASAMPSGLPIAYTAMPWETSDSGAVSRRGVV